MSLSGESESMPRLPHEDLATALLRQEMRCTDDCGLRFVDIAVNGTGDGCTVRFEHGGAEQSIVVSYGSVDAVFSSLLSSCGVRARRLHRDAVLLADWPVF